MLGALLSLVFSLGAACFGYSLIRTIVTELDPALRAGFSGLVGLGAIGLITLFIGQFPGGLGTLGLAAVWCLSAGALLWRLVRTLQKERPSLKPPAGPQLLLLLGIVLACIFSLVGVLAPADTIEWDSLAYHLAVPKLWLAAGQIQPVSFIHHSNFPFSVDNLYIWGLAWGGEPGAKAFTLAFHLFGIIAIFGLTRQRYGALAAWWSAFAWVTIPAVLWLSGTAYIDVQNGLYAGLGILFVAEFVERGHKDCLWLSGIALGLAAGSKYTGLQTIFAVGLVLLLAGVLAKKSALKAPFTVAALALLIASPWYVKNILWVQNPVYPFFYKQLGGKNWSPYNAEIYQNEQQTFGAARPVEGPANPNYTAGPLEPQRIGHAILGLAYQPGRYINPLPTRGGGFPFGAMGFVSLGGMLLWMMAGRGRKFESATIGSVLISLGMWFVLSEQSRYIIALAVPLSVLAGGAISRLRAGIVLAVLAAIQGLYSFYLLKSSRFDDQIQVVTGKVDRATYLSAVSFYEAAQYLNNAARGGKVILYDEVFGYLLDVPYFWGNPGHTTEMGYDGMHSADDFVAKLKERGFTHVYVNLGIYPPSDPGFQQWVAAMGLQGTPQPFPTADRERLMGDMGWRWKILLAEAVAGGKLVPAEQFGRRLIFTVP